MCDSRFTDGTSVDYFIVNGQTVAERWNYANGSEYFTMRYTFDETGNVIGFSTHYPNFTNGYWEDYLFAKNLQGDVVAMYLITVEPPRLIATYEYDEWGKVKTVRDATGAILTNPAHLANRNPFRYRSYHYDTETGFYYLQSRYYDPIISRFINADSYGSTGQAFLGTNMFAYCLNNPVNAIDQSGYLANKMTGMTDTGVPWKKSTSVYGIITGQGLSQYRDIPFGWSTIGESGCAAVATHNMMTLIGKGDSLWVTLFDYQSHHISDRYLGIWPDEIGAFLRRNQIKYTGTSSIQEMEKLMQNGGVAMLTFWNASTSIGSVRIPDVSQGAHTVALTSDGSGSIMVYNAYSYDLAPREYSSLEACLEGGILIYGFYIYD